MVVKLLTPCIKIKKLNGGSDNGEVVRFWHTLTEYRREVTASAIVFSLIPTEEADNTLMTRLWLQLSTCDGDHPLSGGSHAREMRLWKNMYLRSGQTKA
ncbi:hypothetical protein EVAR_94265_1 [Eumeta japonica]|uniref:Uncharacterized protein n=1 Tax=Eumeta variegata TaxID=151549 RepID=A0A4C1UEU4_EUMVA|nr:hypothetical protein EVAR_94265_1 [Eumeta japonica]